MFSLIITIIAIALVAALALATIYYGGTAFNKGAASANASKLLTQSQQILAADRLYRVDHDGQMPPSMQALVDGNYLKTIPSAMAEQFSAVAANAIEWQMVITPSGRAYSISSSTVDADSCKAVNQMSFGSDGILNKVFTSFKTQCYGPDTASLTVLAVADPAVLGADGSTNTDLPNTPVIVGGANPGTSDWTVTPGTSSGGGSSGGGTSGGGSSGGGSGGTGSDVPSTPAAYPQVAAPSSLFFGTVTKGQMSGLQPVVYQNTTGEAVWVTATFWSSNSSTRSDNFGITNNTCNDNLIPAGGTCTYSVFMGPTQTGALTDTILLSISGNTSYTDYSTVQSVSGTGAASISNGVMVFGFKAMNGLTQEVNSAPYAGIDYLGYQSTCPAGDDLNNYSFHEHKISNIQYVKTESGGGLFPDTLYHWGVDSATRYSKVVCYSATQAEADAMPVGAGMPLPTSTTDIGWDDYNSIWWPTPSMVENATGESNYIVYYGLKANNTYVVLSSIATSYGVMLNGSDNRIYSLSSAANPLTLASTSFSVNITGPYKTAGGFAMTPGFTVTAHCIPVANAGVSIGNCTSNVGPPGDGF